MSGWRLAACGLLLFSLWSPALAGPLDQHEGHQSSPARKAPAPVLPAPVPEKVLGWEPIRCWRQSTAGAISIGESFTVVVTCAVFESDNAQVIPDESRLNVASIQMAPFEILGGSHPPDVHRGSRRFLQYDYQLRIISPDAIGQDVNIPPLTISYRIHSRVGAAATLEGRDLSYLMPMMPIKVLSLVPNDASDIRDASEASLAAVDSLRFRSSLFRVLTIVFGALGAVMVVLALLPLARRSRVDSTIERDRIPDRAVMARVIDDLDEVQKRASAEGWSDDMLSRALGDARLVAAAAIGQSISQKPLTGNVNGSVKGNVPEGRILVGHGLIRANRATVASFVTVNHLAKAAQSASFKTTRQQQLEGLQGALNTFTNALYPKEPRRDVTSLDDAVRYVSGVARDIAKERSWQSSLWARR
ncbi:MAG: hypothetical protein ABI983_01295 [Acidobacteriota bacterium]